MRDSLKLGTLALFICAGSAAFLGIFNANLYNDNNFVRGAWLANDWVTLLVALPLLAFAFIWRNKKSDLLWLGVLSYLFYNYCFYLFGANFNDAFLFYVAIVSLSFFGIIGKAAIISIQAYKFNWKIGNWNSAFLLLLSVMLCIIEIPPCIEYIKSGKIPDLNLKTNHPTNVVYALDLSFIVPGMLISSILNLKKNVWGGVLTTMMLVKAVTYGCVLIAGTIALMIKGERDPLLPVWIFITAGGAFFLILQLYTLKVDLHSRAFT